MSANARNFDRQGAAIPNVPNDSTIARRIHAGSIANFWLFQRPVIFDTETTGLGECQCCEISAVDAAGVTLIDTLVKPTVSMPAEAQAVHGISDDDLIDAPTFNEVVDTFTGLIRGRLLLAYNTPFDLRAIVQSGKQADPPVDFDFCIASAARCVQELYAYWWGEWDHVRGIYRWQKLQHAAERHNLIRGQAHRALTDAQLTRQLLLFMANYRPMPGEGEE